MLAWRNRTLHTQWLGRFLVFFHVPLVLSELFANAGVVFLSSKVHLLMQALSLADSTTSPIMGRFLSVSLWSSALAVPPRMLLYFVMSMYYLFRLKGKGHIQLHIAYIQLFIIETLGTGTVRYIIRSLFLASTSCEPFGDDPRDTIRIQASGAILAGLVTFGFKCVVSLTLERNDQQEVLRSLLGIDIAIAILQCLVAWYVGLPLAHDCPS